MMPPSGDEQPSVPPLAIEALAAAKDCLGACLVAAYLHGSAVRGGLRPDSDVDILLVIDGAMRDETRRRFVTQLMTISGRPRSADGRRPLELVVFNQADLQPLPYPPRSEFLYGEWLRDGFGAGAVPQPETNPDLAVLIAQTRQAAVTLAGPPARELLPEVSTDLLRRAIADAHGRVLSDLLGDERNVLLTLARMWRTLETGEIVPKDVAAEWAMRRLEGRAAALVEYASRAYLGLVADDWLARGAETEAVAGGLSRRVAALA